MWESEENFMSYLYVSVTAVQGGNRSKAVLSESFSYNSLKTTHKTCEWILPRRRGVLPAETNPDLLPAGLLEFPPAVLTVEDLGSWVSFQNPLHLHKQLEQLDKEGGASLRFTVSTDDVSLCRTKCL